MEWIANAIDRDQKGHDDCGRAEQLPILHTFPLIENVPEMSRLLNRFSIKNGAGDFLV
jgi:hypothetical protein